MTIKCRIRAKVRLLHKIFGTLVISAGMTCNAKMTSRYGSVVSKKSRLASFIQIDPIVSTSGFELRWPLFCPATTLPT